MNSSRPFTTGQAAEYCHVSQATIINWIKDGKLSGYTTPGGHYRIPRPDLIAFLRDYGMPIDEELCRPRRPRLLLLSESSAILDLVRELSGSGGFEVSLTSTDYAASAEAVRSRPDVAIIDAETSTDPGGLCQWLSESVDGVAILLVGDGRGATLGDGTRLDACIPPNALETLKRKLEAMLL
jgi:excisionase family DNA binding protein